MIKNWKLFLESNDDNESFQNAEDLKIALKQLIKPLLVGEFLLRLSGDKKEISTAVDLITDLFKKTFKVAIEDREDIEDDRKEIFVEIFEKSVDESKSTFIESSFTEGIESMVDRFINTLDNMRKEIESEGEEWREEKEKDYSELSKSELNSLIDDALDKRDFDRVKFLSKYIKESSSVESKEIIEEICYEVVNLFIEYIYKYI